jgi:hypothetical protein
LTRAGIDLERLRDRLGEFVEALVGDNYLDRRVASPENVTQTLVVVGC